jgi:hypothetical protein
MKTKLITLIILLLFCLSGSVFAEENKSELGYKKTNYRNDALRSVPMSEEKSFGKVSTVFGKVSTKELISKIVSLKKEKIDLSPIWRWEDFVQKIGGLNYQTFDKYRNPMPEIHRLLVNPYYIENNLVFFKWAMVMNRRLIGFKGGKNGTPIGGRFVYDYEYKSAVLYLKNADKLKLRKKFYIYAKQLPSADIVLDLNGVKRTEHHYVFVYGDKLNTDEKNEN